MHDLTLSQRRFCAYPFENMNRTMDQPKQQTQKWLEKTVQRVIPPKNSTWPYLNEISPHFIYEIKTSGYDIIYVSVFLPSLKRGSSHARPLLLQCNGFFCFLSILLQPVFNGSWRAASLSNQICPPKFFAFSVAAVVSTKPCLYSQMRTSISPGEGWRFNMLKYSVSARLLCLAQ